MPLQNITGSVHVVPADFVRSSVCDDNCRRAEYDKHINEENGWVAKFFYVKIFHRSSGGNYEFVDEVTDTQ